MADVDDGVRIWQGQIVPQTYTAGFVVLSYFISFVGSWTTLELLHKRTAGRGLYNWFLLGGSAITMGAVAIWCMHFVGNRAVYLGDGQQELQIVYDAGFTALSFLLPIFVLLVAFLAVGSNDKVGWWRVTLGGTLAGLAICGMHYLGQAGIANYTCVYKVGVIVGSAIIAVLASIAALTIFFLLRAAWTNSWWKRASCAVILAAAVSGMHWLASAGTSYRFKTVDSARNENLSRTRTVIVVIVLSVTSCSLLMGMAVIAQRRRLQSATRTKQVVLACVTFDPEGRLMVTPEGSLPSQKITNSFIERSFDDVFSISHPVFLWVFRASRNWYSILDLLPGMRTHLNATTTSYHYKPTERAATHNYTNREGIHASEDYSVIFRELFCTAASELACQVGEPLENLGVLYDEIMSTGTTSRMKTKDQVTTLLKKGRRQSSDLESGVQMPIIFGRGQLLFVIRKVNKTETTRLMTHGFRFAAVSTIVDILSRSMQVKREELNRHLESMRNYSSSDHVMEPGVHLGCFAIRAKVGGSFDVLVRKNAKNQLPAVPLQIPALEDWHTDFLSRMDGWTVRACTDWLGNQAVTATNSELAFGKHLRNGLFDLNEMIGDPLFLDAVLVATPTPIPCRGFGSTSKPGWASLIAFHIIFPIHTLPSNEALWYTPLSVFRCQQHVYRNAPDHEVFARRVHREFAPIVDLRPKSVKPPSSPHRSSMVVPHLTISKSAPDMKQWWGPLSALDRRPTGPPSTAETEDENEQHLGSIMVSQEVSVDVREVEEGVESDMHMMGSSGCASTEMEDGETFVDRLLAICVEARQ